MKQFRFGRTNLMVSHSGFGALPIQRVSFEEAAALLRRAYEAGINFFDTANMYSDSEAKIGAALSDVRGNIMIATKTMLAGPERMMKNLENSLKMMKTDYVDLLQLHNPDRVPMPGDEDGAYEMLLQAKRQGKVRFIGVTNHRLRLAKQAVESGHYDSLQFPLSVLSSDADLGLSDLCKRHDIGLIAMKAMSGGLVRSGKIAFAFLSQYDNILPIWGVQRMSELEEFLSCEANPPELNAETRAVIDEDRSALKGAFCRGCGYCLPCPANIPIPTAARLSLLMARSPAKPFLGKEWQAEMDKIDECTACRHCSQNCPYGLDTPKLLKEEKIKYDKALAALA
ncbi:MAG: aldo/keto reductase [Peptococcaceae bacterium]|jgi:aryl-alcohol dehydrogenase-like predicted oxidoreductase|nr:aldo/keto reductase [Peptococcaceae bacterium]